jgi:acyl carrier protein
MIERMYADGVRTFVEVGPRDVLTSLVGNILEGREHLGIALDRSSHEGLRGLWEGLGALAVSGVAMNWDRLREGHKVSADLSQPSEPKFSVAIDGGNYGRPYPPPEGAAKLPPLVVNAPVTPAAAPANGNSSDAYRIFQESITAAHRDWQSNLAKGHEAFLRTMEAAFGSGSGGKLAEPLPSFTLPVAPEPVPNAVEVPQPPLLVSSRAVLWEIVAEKTGYPADMLEPAMALEGDLGIDSIKRVEIFSALQERFPSLAGVDQSSVARLRTLGDVVAALDQIAPAAKAMAAAAEEEESSRAMVWQVVADKTGYPADMLEPVMALEGDLGIDSIKRVEIFSALQEYFPGIAGMDQAGVATLRTLGDVVAALDGAAPAARPFSTESELPKRYIVAPRSAPASGHATLRPLLQPGESIVISDDARGVANALVSLLEKHGFQAAIGDTSPHADVWICLHESHADALRFAQAAARRPGAFITVEDSGRPWAGGLSALAKTAAIEWPNARVKAIRLEAGGRAPEIIAKAILDELLTGGPEPEIELAADGSRSVPEILETGSASHHPVSPASLPANPVIVATGGARGVTAACLQELAKALRPKFVLFGRTPLAEEPDATRDCFDTAAIHSALLANSRAQGSSIAPMALKNQTAEILAAREVRATIQALERAGAQVRYFALDARDANAVDPLSRKFVANGDRFMA